MNSSQNADKITDLEKNGKICSKIFNKIKYLKDLIRKVSLTFNFLYFFFSGKQKFNACFSFRMPIYLFIHQVQKIHQQKTI